MKVTGSRLDTVIRVKKHQEKKTQRELVQIQEKKETEKKALSEMREEHASAVGKAGRVERTRATELQTSHAFIQKLSRQIERQQQTVDKIQLREQSKREELVEKSRSKKVVERLDEKRRAEQEKEVGRKEQVLLDVLAQRTKPMGR